jgi:hypothetical protein
MALHTHTSYSGSFEAIARALKSAGLNLEAVSFSSGHILFSCQNESGMLDKAIIALRQAAPDSDSSASSGTDVRIFCDSRNRTLTLGQIKNILTGADPSGDDHNKAGAGSL